MVNRPVIGICAALAQAKGGYWDECAALLSFNYIRAIQDAGGMVLMIPPDPELERDPDEVLDLVDGLILAGGSDIDPSRYGAEPHAKTRTPVHQRDSFEIEIARRAWERDLPVLGICRGMQLLNVSRGGTLIQHLPDEFGHEDHRRVPGSFDGSDHDVRLAPETLAARAAGEEVHVTKSHHHQGIEALGDGLEVTGHATLDSLPEAIESPSHRFMLGVQWHPEADESSTVVEAFVDAARAYRQAREPAVLVSAYRQARGSS